MKRSPVELISPGGKIAQIQRNFPQTERKIDRKEHGYLSRNFQINQTVKSDLAITPMDIEQTNFFYPTSIDESG